MIFFIFENKIGKIYFYEILDFKLKYYTTMCLSPNVLTASLYLGYKTYTSYYSNSEFEELDLLKEKMEKKILKK